MQNLIKTNKYLGWISIFGLIFTLSVIVNLLDPEVVMVILLPIGIAIPFFFINCISVLNRKKFEKQITKGIRIGIILIIGIPILFPFLFDFEFIYVSLIGMALGMVMWKFRNSRETQLIIFNSISIILVLFYAWIGLELAFN